MKFKVGDRVSGHPVVHPDDRALLIYSESVGTVTEVQGNFVFVNWNDPTLHKIYWNDSRLVLALDGLDRILEKL